MGKNEIRPLYSEFQGYLSQAPEPKDAYASLYDESMWDQYNNSIDLLNKTSGEDFSRFGITPQRGQTGDFIRIVTYRQKLGGLISHLHGKYFSDEVPPFSGMPTTVIQQSQQQNQSVQILLEVQSKIDEKINQFKEGSKERTFLQKLKGSLSSISNISQLFNTLFSLAEQNGITVGTLSSIFG
jgi:hypothetical protein